MLLRNFLIFIFVKCILIPFLYIFSILLIFYFNIIFDVYIIIFYSIFKLINRSLNFKTSLIGKNTLKILIIFV